MMAGGGAEEGIPSPGPPPHLGPPPLPPCPPADVDGNFRMYMEKKSKSKLKGWQKRWFVIDPRRHTMEYFVDPLQESFQEKKKEVLNLKACTAVTSNNMGSSHVELHGVADKVIQLRVSDKSGAPMYNFAMLQAIFLEVGLPPLTPAAPK